jgi:uncharacterized repeat protein (TIGR01451 family)
VLNERYLNLLDCLMQYKNGVWKRIACGLFALGALLPLQSWAQAELQVTQFLYTTPQLNGATVSFTVDAKNNGDVSADNVNLRVFLPSNFTFSTAPSGCVLKDPPYTWSTPSNPDPGGTYNTLRQLLCNYSSVAAGASKSIAFQGVAASSNPPEVANMLADIYSDYDEGVDAANNTLPKQITVNTGSDLALASTPITVSLQGGAQIAPPDNAHVLNGSTVSIAIKSKNNGPNATSSARIVATLPSTANFGSVSASGTSWSCANASNTITCNYTGGNVASGASFPDITIGGTLTASVAGAVVIQATISSPANVDPDSSNNGPASITLNLDPGLNLTASKQLRWNNTSVTSVAYGQPAVFRIGIVNAGPESLPAGGAQVSDTIDAGWTLGAMPAGCSNAGQVVTCTNAGAIASGASATFDIPVTAPASGAPAGPNIATVTLLGGSGKTETNTGDNTASLTYTWTTPSADVNLVSKTKSRVSGSGPILDTEQMQSVLTAGVTSASTATATGTITLTDTLTNFPYEQFVSASGTNWSCSIPVPGTPSDPSNNVITCTNSNPSGVAPGANLPALTIVTQASLATAPLGALTLANTACTGKTADAGYTLDANTANDCKSAQLTSTKVLNVPVTITKTTSTPAGGDKVLSDTESAITYTLSISNTSGTDTIPTLVITDAIPTYKAFVASVGTTGVSAAITGAGAGESCSGTSTVTCMLKNVGPGTTRTVTLTVSRPMLSGTYNNTATLSSPDATLTGTLSASDTVTVDPITEISVSKAATPTSPKTGETVGFTITVNVNGPDGANGLKVYDRFDTTRFSLIGSATISPNPNGASCAVQALNPGIGYATNDNLVDGGTGLYCDLGNISTTAGSATVITIVYNAKPIYPYPDALPATHNSHVLVKTTSTESDAATNRTNNYATLSLSVQPPSLNLVVSEDDTSFDPTLWDDTVAPTITYHVLAQNSNSSSSIATQVKVVNIPKPPANFTMTFASGTRNAVGNYVPTSFTCTAPAGATQKVTCTFDDLPSGKTVGIDLTYTLAKLGASPTGAIVFENDAKICSQEAGPPQPDADGCSTSSTNYDTATADNTIIEKTTVLPKTDLHLISKTADNAAPDINQVFNYSIKLRNKGPSDAPLLTLTDTLPTGMRTAGAVTVSTGTGVSLTTNTCTSIATGSSSVTCNLGPLPTDGNADGAEDATKMVTVTIPVKVDASVTPSPQPGTYTNTACVAPATDATDFHSPKLLVSKDLVSANDCKSVNVSVPVKAQLSGKVYYSATLTPSATTVSGGISGVTVTMTGTAGTANGVTRTTTTDSNGAYSFDNLPPGTYTLTETQPSSTGASGYYDGRTFTGTLSNGDGSGMAITKAAAYVAAAAADSITGIVLNNNGVGANFNFEEYKPVTVQGTVYHDANNNGLLDEGGSPGLAGAKLRLSGTDYRGTALALSDFTTTSSGQYSFTAPPTADAAGYVITEVTEPSSTLDGLDQNGAGTVVNNSAGRAAGTDTLSLANTLLVPGASLTNRNFGELKAASLSGFVFIDSVGADAVRSGTETAGVTSVTLTLTGTNDLGQAVNTTTQSGALGAYIFGSLRPGTYTVTVTVPAGMTHTGAQAGSKQGTVAGVVRTAGTGVTGVGNVAISAITLASNDAATGYNFGETGQGLSGFVYVDYNNDGIKDAAEIGIQGVTVTLSGNTSTGQDVCAAINPSPCTATTDSQGAYAFAGLPASDATGYTLTEQSQATSPLNRYTDGKETAGKINGATVGNASTNDKITNIVLPAGQFGTEYNFGEQGGSISGTVYLDVAPFGAMGTGDTGIAGVTVTLSGNATATGASICNLIGAGNCTKTTDAQGNFSFGGLVAGSYTITETQPADYVDSVNTAGATGGAVTSCGGSNCFTGIPLTTALSASGYQFGEKAGSITGFVYLDANNDGIKQGGETGIAGVTVTITGTSASGGTPCGQVACTAVTQADGSYTLSGLRNADATGYTITETQPAGYIDGKVTKGTENGAACSSGCVDTVVNVISAIPFNVAKTYANFNFGELQAASIAGRVWNDAVNNNGTYEAGEEIAGVTLTLTGNDDRGAAVNVTATTAADGTYSFANLRPSAGAGYTVTEMQPNGISDYAGNTGTQVGTLSSVAVGTAAQNGISAIVLPSGGSGINYNFRETASSLAGFVYVDANGNGIKDAGETPIAGVTITLTGTDANNAAVSRTKTTGADGSYLFSGLTSGTYTLTETQPNGYNDGRESAGSAGGTVDNSAFDATPARNAISAIALPAGNTATAYNFGELLPAGGGGGVVSGRVYVDANNNGVIDSGEQGIAGVTVTLTGTSSDNTTMSRVTQTSDDGSYFFTAVPPSDGIGYTITEIQPSAYTDGKTTIAAGNPGETVSSKPVAAAGADAITKVTVPSGAVRSNYNFGERLAGTTLSGFVYVDSNDNGVKDTGESGIPGVTVKLSGTTAGGASVNLSTTTAADGSYSFTNLQASNAGGYIVTEVQPTGYLDGKTSVATGNPGTAMTAKPVASGESEQIVGIVLVNGAQLANYNFGERLSGNTVSGFVYGDANDNGVKDSGEEGIVGVTVKLTGTDSTGKAVDLSTVTAADGSYSFTKLVASNDAGYTITEVQPSTYADGKTTVAAGNPGAPKSGKPVASGSVDTIEAVTVKDGSNLTNYNFGEKVSTGTISGFVYVDKNDNGVMDAGEEGIAGVTLRLSGTDNAGTAVKLSVTSAADGSFSFTKLRPSGAGGYTVTEMQPPKYADGKTTIAAGNPGTANSKKPVRVGDEDRIAGITLGATSLTGYLFGERLVPSLKPPIVNGYVWLDRAHNRNRPVDGSLEGMPGWTVQLKQSGALICTTNTDGTGFYQFDNLHCPGYEFSGLPTGSGFSITFSKDGSNLPAVPTSGGNRGEVPPTGGQISNITLNPADEVVEQNLPLDPAGVVYDAVTRKPVAGASVTISGPPGFNPETHLVGGTAAHTQVIGSDGLYQFLLQNDFPNGVYTLSVVAPAGYLPAPSTLLPACNGAPVVTLVPTPALIQASDFAPSASVTPQLDANTCAGIVAGGATTTQYYFGFNITNGGSAPILNNHIPLDPILSGAILVTKTTPMVTVARGDLVPYTITATNTQATAVSGVVVRDQMPPGFKYRSGSARSGGVAAEPTVSGRVLSWPSQSFGAKEKKTYTLVLAVGTGVGDGDYVNQAFAVNGVSDLSLSNLATATVRIIPDATFDCPDIIGKVFDDRNANGYQDQDEPGIPAVRLATPRGLLVTTDAEGRFHVPCVDIPNMDRGSNFVMKLDDRTLPSGYRLTTENPRDVRVTRGKMVKLNFGATIHRVVRIELADAAFEAGEGEGTALRPEWHSQIDTMIEQLKTRPSIVRIAYQRGSETEEQAAKRVAALHDDIRKRWSKLDGMYTLVIETEGAK